MIRTKIALLALGANLPFDGMKPEDTLKSAVKAFPSVKLALPRLSRLFLTPCFPVGAGPDYVNATALLEVEDGLSATELMARLHQLESLFGRKRETRWGMRTLDIDLLALDDRVIPDIETHSYWRSLDPELQLHAAPDQLILPHPRLQDRAFVLLPLADVAPDWVHPILQQTVAQMLSALPAADLAAMRPL